MGVRCDCILVVLALGSALSACSSDTPAASPDAAPTQDVPAVKDRVSMDLPALPDAVALDTPPRDAVSEREPGACATSADCTSDLDRRVCDTATGRCVRCTAAEDTCPAAEHCDEALHACASGCHTDDGCVTTSGQRLRCDRTRHACVACLANADCPPNTICVGGACMAGCDADRGCATGLTCCTRTLACINTATDTSHCGGCDRACPTGPHATATCAAGACGVRCEAGFGDCNGRADDGCETDLQTTADHCGRCGSTCSGGQMCAMGACVTTCPTGQTACGTACVDLATDARHCGMCDRACTTGEACAGGRCAPSLTISGNRNLSTDSLTPGARAGRRSRPGCARSAR